MVPISMRTDTYDPAAFAARLSDPDERTDPADGAIPTLPVDLSEWTASITGDLEGDDDAETTRASQAALRRWADGR